MRKIGVTNAPVRFRCDGCGQVKIGRAVAFERRDGSRVYLGTKCAERAETTLNRITLVRIGDMELGVGKAQIPPHDYANVDDGPYKGFRGRIVKATHTIGNAVWTIKGRMGRRNEKNIWVADDPSSPEVTVRAMDFQVSVFAAGSGEAFRQGQRQAMDRKLIGFFGN